MGWILLLLSLAGIAAVTLRPEGEVGGRQFRWQLALDARHLAEDILNATLFVPIGVAVERIGRSPLAALLASAGISAAIELTQRYLVAGRFAELQDIIANTAGGLLGWAVAALLARAREGERPAP